MSDSEFKRNSRKYTVFLYRFTLVLRKDPVHLVTFCITLKNVGDPQVIIKML